MTSAATKFLVILTALFLGIMPLTHAQDNRPDMIHITLPPQVHSVTLQTAKYIVLGKKDRAKYGKSFLGYTGMQVHCHQGQKLKPKELRRILKKIRIAHMKTLSLTDSSQTRSAWNIHSTQEFSLDCLQENIRHSP